MKALPLAIFGVAILATTTSKAQPFYRRGGGYVNNRAATPAESYARGMSKVMVGAGAGNLLNSEAAINMTDARSNQLDNKLKGQQTFYEMRRQNQYYQDAMRPSKMTQERLTQLAHEKAPKRLAPTQLDPVTGSIAWPIALTDDPFAKDRDTLDALYAERASHSGAIGLKSYQEIRSTCNTMKKELNSRVKDYPPGDFVTARKFIDSLAYDARHQT